ncbi:unnamed protein product [Miscanthus lutarioriparius]|uniref:H15 domain-containing protein n=1 Tax=Miscanthus lutarioriparius TaxID=422564 RepID=A0A811NAW6_9POAL|nr:unnamed protein product [Miscanthus lutarioriparius]
MAGKDGAAPPPPPPPLPSYPKMIMEAIHALGLENVSNKIVISDYIKGRYGSSLPVQHNAILMGHLARMMATGELTFLRNNYLLPDDDDDKEASPLRTDGHKDPADVEDSTGVLDATSFLLDFDDDELLAPLSSLTLTTLPCML